MRRVAERLQDILDAIEAIERYTQQGKTHFEREELIQVWVVHPCEIIGEAVNTLPSDLLNQCPEIPWRQIISLRNRLIHEYFRVDPQVIWNITQQDLPPLKTAIIQLLKNNP